MKVPYDAREENWKPQVFSTARCLTQHQVLLASFAGATPVIMWEATRCNERGATRIAVQESNLWLSSIKEKNWNGRPTYVCIAPDPTADRGHAMRWAQANSSLGHQTLETKKT